MATKVLPFNLFSGEQKNIPAKDEPSHIAAASDVVLIATKLGKYPNKNSIIIINYSNRWSITNEAINSDQ
jgi:hypothetical protein